LGFSFLHRWVQFFVTPDTMRLAVLFSVCISLVITSLLNGAQFSENRDLPPLRLVAADLDSILLKAQLLIAVANGPSGQQDSGRETVTVGVRGEEIEIPHLSVASTVAFPTEVFRFRYTYYLSDKPISAVTLDFSDYSRRLSVSGESADQVQSITKLLENDLRRYSTTIGGAMFRRVAGLCLLGAFLTSLMFSGAYWWNTRRHNALGMVVCSALGLLLVLLVPWNRYLSGFALYQTYSRFFLVRHAAPIFFLSLVATLFGIPVSYFLPRWRRKA